MGWGVERFGEKKGADRNKDENKDKIVHAKFGRDSNRKSVIRSISSHNLFSHLECNNS